MRALAIALLLPGAAMADPWHGIWSADPAWCAEAARIGSVTPAPILLSAGEILGYENSCAVTGVTDTGLNAWVIETECQSEGDTLVESRLILVDGDRLWMWFGSDEPIAFSRCPQ